MERSNRMSKGTRNKETEERVRNRSTGPGKGYLLVGNALDTPLGRIRETNI